MDDKLPFHLLLPLVASLVFVFGLMLVKKARSYGVNVWTITFTANMLAFLLFSSYLVFGNAAPAVAEPGSNGLSAGSMLSMIWQPALIAVLFILGQVFTFSAISHGDVSVATPIFSVKVLLVAFLVTFVAGESLSPTVWIAAALAMVGIVLVQFSGGAKPARIGFTVLFALLAANSFAMHDVVVQRFAPSWGMDRFLPIVFAVAAVLSLGFLPLIENPFRLERKAQLTLLAGALCIAIQAMCIISTLSLFGDAARVNIVYSLRGLWGVLLAFLLAGQFASEEANVSRGVMVRRFVGAALLTAAVILAIAGPQLL